MSSDHVKKLQEAYRSVRWVRDLVEDNDLDDISYMGMYDLKKFMKACKALVDDFPEYLPKEENNNEN
jgi:hypothetical protein